jgi:hypothetical protein
MLDDFMFVHSQPGFIHCHAGSGFGSFAPVAFPADCQDHLIHLILWPKFNLSLRSMSAVEHFL